MNKQKPKVWYAITNCEDPENWSMDFYRRDTKFDVDYELDLYKELIPNIDKLQTLAQAEVRAKDVLLFIWDAEVCIVLVHESEDGYMDCAEFVKVIKKNKRRI